MLFSSMDFSESEGKKEATSTRRWKGEAGRVQKEGKVDSV